MSINWNDLYPMHPSRSPFPSTLRMSQFEALQFGVAKVDAAVGGVGGLSFRWPRRLEMKYIWNKKTVGKHGTPGVCLQFWIASNFGEVILGSSESRRQVTGRQHDSVCPLMVFIIVPKIVLCSMKFHTLSWDVINYDICIFSPRKERIHIPAWEKGTLSSNIPKGWGHVCSRRVAKTPTAHAMVVGVSGNVATEDVVQTPSWLGSHQDDDNIGKVWVFLVARKVIVYNAVCLRWQFEAFTFGFFKFHRYCLNHLGYKNSTCSASQRIQWIHVGVYFCLLTLKKKWDTTRMRGWCSGSV